MVTISNVKIENNGNLTFDLANLPPGVYDYQYSLSPGSYGSFSNNLIPSVFYNPLENQPGVTTLRVTVYYSYKKGEETISGSENSNEVSFYAPPEKFEFINAIEGKTWEVALGINSLIKNITDFTVYATQYKMFLEQSEDIEPCPSMFRKLSEQDEQKVMSASQLNKIVDYLTNGEEKGGYEKGNRVGASIFRKLEKLINPPE